MSCSTSDTATKKSRKNKCSCPLGSIIPRWMNVTQVWTQSDCADPTTKAIQVANGTTIPKERLDLTYDAGVHGAGVCTTCGKCGGWLVGGDYNGLSAQEVTLLTDDIVAGATPDATHRMLDHNSYQSYLNAAASFFQVGDIAQIVTLGSTDWNAMAGTSGVTYKVGDIFTVAVVGSGTGTAQLMKDMTMPRRRGGNWCFAQKWWHGRFPFTSFDNTCGASPTNPVDNVKYRKMVLTASATQGFQFEAKSVRNSDGSVLSDLLYVMGGSYSASATQEIGRLTGLVTGTSSEDNVSMSCSITNQQTGLPVIQGQSEALAISYHLNLYPSGVDISNCLANWITGCVSGAAGFNFNNMNAVYAATGALSAADLTAMFATANSTLDAAAVGSVSTGQAPGHYTVDLVTISDTILELHVTVNPNSSTLNDGTNTTTITSSGTSTFHFKVELSLPYTDADVYFDWCLAMAAFDLSDFNLSSLRLDEKLHHAILMMWDERQAAVNLVDNFHETTMPDYSKPQIAGNWQTMDWEDSHSYYWMSADGDGQPMNTAGGNVKWSPMYSGIIVPHSAPLVAGKAAGAPDRHFWFGATTYARELAPSPGVGYLWLPYSHGAYSDGYLPQCATRWMAPFDEQYDAFMSVPLGITPNCGNFPQAFLEFGGSVGRLANQGRLRGGKYCQAVQKWNAVDYLRPCAADKFAVDQTTVCCVTNASLFNPVAGGALTVAPTTGATAPSSGYVVAEGLGVYPVVSLVGTTLNLAPRVDTLPTGYNFRDPEEYDDTYAHIGKLRWIGYTQYSHTFSSAPGIRGRVAITTAYAAGVLTVTTGAAQPYFRVDPASGLLRAVNLYDASGTLLAAGLVLAKQVGDTTDKLFNATTTDHPTAVWMADANLTWAQSQFTTASQGTGVYLNYKFDQRNAARPAADQHAWLGGSGAGTGTGVVGCLASDYSVAQFNYTPNFSCPAIIACLPAGSPENFDHSPTPATFPTTFPLDGFYGSHWQSYIALTMPDPFWEKPFVPSGDGVILSWKEDDGTGYCDTDTFGVCLGAGVAQSTPPHSTGYYAMCPLVEANSAPPAGRELPVEAGGNHIRLYFDLVTPFTPPNYPWGIPLGHDVTSDWATTDRICANVTRFVADYAAWNTC